MAAWGTSPFENDDAADFGAEMDRAQDVGVLADALYAIPDEDNEYVEFGTAARALVAAEMIAAQRGAESGDIPDPLMSWVQEQGDADDALVERARRAVLRVQRDSEMCELWRESGSFADWNSHIKSLIRRLGR